MLIETKHYRKAVAERCVKLNDIVSFIPVDNHNKQRKKNRRTYVAAVTCKDSTAIAVMKKNKPIRLITIYKK